jgi:uncharacterized protein YegJ (DUF2314 family)
MSLTTTLSEIWRFIKDKKIKILIGAILVSVLTVGGGAVLQTITDQTSDQEESSVMGTSNENLQESREFLTHVYEQEPATFEMFVQLEDGNVFINSFIFDEYFTSPDVVEKIENRTGVSYNETIEHEQRLQLNKTSAYRGSIAGIRDTSSNVITLRVQAGKTAEENLTLANAFEEMLTNQEVSFAEDLQITMIKNAEIGESLQEEDLEMVSSSAALGNFAPAESESSSMLLYATTGFIMGLLIMILILFVIQLFKDKINYTFQYSWDFEDYHVLYSGTENDNLVELLLYPEERSRIIASQETTIINELTNHNDSLHDLDVVSNLSLNIDKPDEIILLVESKKTEKDWYQEQYQIAELLDSQITIIQVVN